MCRAASFEYSSVRVLQDFHALRLKVMMLPLVLWMEVKIGMLVAPTNRSARSSVLFSALTC